jgi:hypothetical protein
MATEKNLREELLKQNGGGTQPRDELRDKILAQEQTQLALTKRLTIYSWIFVAVGLILAGVIPRSYREGIMTFEAEWASAAIAVWKGLLLIAVIFTVALYVRYRTLTIHQIQARLAAIEEYLKKMADKQ